MKNRYEFCYLDNFRRPMFCIMWDDNLLSACERLLCRSVNSADLNVTEQGNYLVRGWEPNEIISVKETSGEISTSFATGLMAKPMILSPATSPLNIGDLDLSKTK
jgi:hypothetical protein